MSVRDVRRARGEATRSALLEAAIESVALHGLSGTTLSTVAEQAGVSRASVGFHFKGKEQLLSAALDLALERYEMPLSGCAQSGDYAEGEARGNPHARCDIPHWISQHHRAVVCGVG